MSTHQAPHAPNDAGPVQHVLPLSIYWGVFLALIVGTVLTVWSATFDLGLWNTPIALGIAVTKGLLVILFFMHVKYSTRLTWLFVAGGFVFFLIMVIITMTDFATRTWL